MVTFTGTPQQFMGNIIDGRIVAATATLAATSTTYTERTGSDPALSLLACDGNSLPFGSGVPSGSEFTLNYVITCHGLLQASQTSHLANVWRCVNFGLGSAQTPELTARFEATVQPGFNTLYRRRVVYLQEYINHRRRGATHAAALAAYLAYYEQAVALGWEVLVATVPPTGPSDIFFPGTGLDTSEMNTYLLANVASLSPFPIVDVVAAGLDDPTDLTYWNADQVHPNTTGYALWAETLHDVVAAIAT